MLRLTILALAFIASYFLFLLVRRIITSSHHARRARRLGCEAPVRRVPKDPLGLDLLFRLSAADKRDRVPDEILELYREVKADTFANSFLGQRSVLTINPKNVQAILATQFHDFQLGAQRANCFMPMLGAGIFSADGKSWEHSRALLRPQFSRQQVADLELLEVHVQHMFKHLDLIVDDYNNWSAPIDLGPLFFRLTLDSATEFLFGQSVQSQLQALPAGHASQGGDSELDWRSLAGAFDRGTSGLAARARLGDLCWMYNPKTFRDDCKEVQRFADYYVSQALQRLESENEKEKPEEMTDEKDGKDGKKKRYVFLEELIKDTKDPIELRCQLLHILLAGRDTTAGLLGWTCWNLARNPAVFNKLRTTILETFGSYDQPHEITFERLKTCGYLQHTLNETLRLYPSVPVNSREATRDTSLPRGGGPDGQSRVYIKKGEDVGYSVYAMHRRKDIWGDDAEQFVPERWVGRKTGWEYLPFNGGPRICLGQQFALTEAGYVLTRLIQRFDRMVPCQPHEEPKHQYSVTSAPKKVLVRMHMHEIS